MEWIVGVKLGFSRPVGTRMGFVGTDAGHPKLVRHGGHVRVCPDRPYPPDIWAWYEGCRIVRTDGLGLRYSVGSLFSIRAVRPDI